jgi:hypothetical protein
MLVMIVGTLPGLSACTGTKVPLPPPVSPATPPPVPRVSVSGVIVNGVNARPLIGAIIELDGRPRAESGADGRFRFDDVPVGPHLLSTRVPKFRPRVQPVAIVMPDPLDTEGGRRNDFIVLLFAPSAYFDGFPPFGDAPPCLKDSDCPPRQLCLMNSFKEIDASSCAVPKICATEDDCKLGQQCEPVTLQSGEETRVCHGQPAPEVTP